MIFLTEYDEKKHLQHTFEEGRIEGIKEGIKEGMKRGGEDKLFQMIQKKHNKGKSMEQIAEELEEETEVIQEVWRRHRVK